MTTLVRTLQCRRMDLERLPGGDLIAEGLRDLAAGQDSVPALLVLIGAPRLTALGLSINGASDGAEHRLYQRLASEDAVTAHSRYNALIRRLVSFERAAACAG
jgi:hypothetical protein